MASRLAAAMSQKADRDATARAKQEEDQRLIEEDYQAFLKIVDDTLIPSIEDFFKLAGDHGVTFDLEERNVRDMHAPINSGTLKVRLGANNDLHLADSPELIFRREVRTGEMSVSLSGTSRDSRELLRAAGRYKYEHFTASFVAEQLSEMFEIVMQQSH